MTPPVAEPVDPPRLEGLMRIHTDQARFRWSVDGGDGVSAVESPPVTLDLTPGGRTVIRGPSGVGKSTFAAGMVRFVTMTSGGYRIDGADVTRLRGDDVRRFVAWSEQEPWFAGGSVAQNLRLADSGATDVQLEDVLRSVHLDAWLGTRPERLDTQVGPGGAFLSGGERQRLSLARMLLANRRVLILDEPTAHLDQATASAVIEELVDASEDRSVVVITHHPLDLGDSTTVELSPLR